MVIGVVTSPTGAVIRDILHRLTDRFGVHVLLWGTLVQGSDAAGQVARAVRGFDAMPTDGPVPRPDLLIVARGGGSLEDLWAFNEEEVVRAVADCTIPVISAIGHETDTTLIDFVADQRAPTPTAAAEMAVPVQAELLARLAETDARLQRGIGGRLDNAASGLRLAARGLLDPGEMVERRAQALDLALAGLDRGLERRLSDLLLRVSGLAARLRPPERLIAGFGSDLGNFGGRLNQAATGFLDRQTAALDSAARLLSANSFERVLDRGFALVTTPDGQALKRSAEVEPSASVTIRFADASRAARMDDGAPDVSKTPARTAAKKPDNQSGQKTGQKTKGSSDTGQDSLF
jgi:exodeoxyribonuclease VII large subunit